MLKTKIECFLFRKNKEKYEFLLLKCTPLRGGIWQPITGNVESTDASLKDAALREVREETNICPKSILRTIDNIHVFDFREQKNGIEQRIREHVFACEVSMETVVDISTNNSAEHDDYRWLSADDALALLKWKDNKTALTRLVSLLKNEQKNTKFSSTRNIFSKA